MVISPQKIIDITCELLELDYDKLIKDKVRTPLKYCDARLIIAYYCKVIDKDMTYKELASILNNKLKNGDGDHAAAMYSFNTCKNLLEVKDKKFLNNFNKVSDGITAYQFKL